MAVRKDRPAGIRWCGRCEQDAECGAGQSYCKECRAEISREKRAAFNHGVEVLGRIVK